MMISIIYIIYLDYLDGDLDHLSTVDHDRDVYCLSDAENYPRTTPTDQFRPQVSLW